MNRSTVLIPFLKRLRWRLRLRDGLRLAQETLWLAGLAALLVMLAGRIWPIERLWLWALIPMAAWLLAVTGYALFRPLPVMRVARRVDGELHLKERLSTSLALDAEQDSPVYAAFVPELIDQAHEDAIHTARRIQPARDFPLHFLRRPMGIASVLVAAALTLAFVPNPMDSILKERQAVAEEAGRQAQKIDRLKQQVQESQELTPEEREKLLKQLEELAKQLRGNTGDREEALANLSKLEESLRQQIDPKGGQRKAALDAISAQLQAMAKTENPQVGDLKAAAEAAQKLAEQMKNMSEEERKQLAKQLAQMAARAAQAGDTATAQALSSMAQASQSGDAQAAQSAAQQAAQALQQAQSDQAQQNALNQVLSQVQSSQQQMAQAGQPQPGQQANQGQPGQQGQGQQGQGQQGQGQQGQGQQGQGQSQGQGQGQQAGGGGGTNANSLPPSTRTGKAGSPTGPGRDPSTAALDSQVYVPREKMPTNGQDVFIPGQDTNQGQTTSSQTNDPLGGLNNPSLVPYSAVYQTYFDAANQAMDQSYIPPALKDYIKQYFTELEP